MKAIERESLVGRYPPNPLVHTRLETITAEPLKPPKNNSFTYENDDANHMKDILFQLALKGTNDLNTSKDRLPAYYTHQTQVITVTEELISQARIHMGEPVPNFCIPTGSVAASVHDLGRSIQNSEEHIPIGYDIAKKLNIPDEIARFVLLHHQWGLGIEPFGSQLLNKFIRLEKNLSKGYTMQQDPTQFFKEWKDALGTQDEGLFLTAIAVLIADNSKRKRHEAVANESIPYSEIEVFDRNHGLELIQDQIQVQKTYKENSPRHVRELAGLYFLLNCIDYFEKRTGINYATVVRNARSRYLNEVEPQLIEKWGKEYRPQT